MEGPAQVWLHLVVNVNNSYFIANTDAYKKFSPELQGKLSKVAEEPRAGIRTR